MLKNIFIYFIFFFSSSILIGQDNVFSQFYHSPLYTNSALTGAFKGKYRIGTIIRRQWSSIGPNISFNSKNIFGDLRINLSDQDYFSIGFIVNDDNAGLTKIGKFNGYLSLSYAKQLFENKYSGKKQYLVFGVQTGYGKTYFDDGNYLFGIQFDKVKELVNPNIPNNESPFGSQSYLDINSGLMWYISGRKNSFYVGINTSHLNSPNISLIENGSSKLFLRYSSIIGGEIFLDKGLSVLPSIFISSQGSYIQGIIGSSIRYEYYNLEENAFRFGLWTRATNSLVNTPFTDIIVSSIVEFNKLEIGFSYDISISNLHRINNYKGALEISIIYIWGNNPKRVPILCPRF